MKIERHNAIHSLLSKGPAPARAGREIWSQDELRRRLARRGFHVTQATLSRDIHELKLVKGPAGYMLPASRTAAADDEPSGPSTQTMLQSFGLEVRQAQNLLVVITTTGAAQPVAAGVDDEDWPEVVGTIAGDDNVLVICPDARQAEQLRRRLEALIG